MRSIALMFAILATTTASDLPDGCIGVLLNCPASGNYCCNDLGASHYFCAGRGEKASGFGTCDTGTCVEQEQGVIECFNG
jgi:hypothetical protein